MKRINIHEFNTPVVFYEYVPKSGPMPGENEKRTLYTTWAKIDEVWMKDLELAKSNGTLSDLTLTIRDPLSEYRPSNKHYLSIQSLDYQDKRYNIKHVQHDLQNNRYIRIVAGLSE